MAINRVDAPFTGAERAQLTGHLDWVRATVLLKADGLSQQDARRALLPSPLTTVAGLLSHLRWMEAHWFQTILSGQPHHAPCGAADPDGDFRAGAGHRLGPARARLSRRGAGAAGRYEVPFRDSGRGNPRWVLVHVTQETARHAGHLDILREMLDGGTAE